MRRLHAVTALMAAGVSLAAACGNSSRVMTREGATGAETTEVRDDGDGIIHREYKGDMRVPPGAEMVAFEFTDPYLWTATLSFEGNTYELIRNILENLRVLNFRPHWDDSGPPQCSEGSLDDAGAGRCELAASMDAGEGRLILQIDRPTASTPGTLILKRHFDHRMPGDWVGPPYPSPQTEADIVYDSS